MNMITKRRCKYCNKYFTPKNERHFYHTIKCRNYANLFKYLKKNMVFVP